MHSNTLAAGVVSTTASVEYNTIYVRLGDICPEFDSLGVINMCNS